MFRFDEGLKVYLYRGPVDFRAGITGLSILVEQALLHVGQCRCPVYRSQWSSALGNRLDM